MNFFLPYRIKGLNDRAAILENGAGGKRKIKEGMHMGIDSEYKSSESGCWFEMEVKMRRPNIF